MLELHRLLQDVVPGAQGPPIRLPAKLYHVTVAQPWRLSL